MKNYIVKKKWVNIYLILGKENMKSVNLFVITRNNAMKICSQYENVISGRESKLKILGNCETR